MMRQRAAKRKDPELKPWEGDWSPRDEITRLDTLAIAALTVGVGVLIAGPTLALTVQMDRAARYCAIAFSFMSGVMGLVTGAALRHSPRDLTAEKAADKKKWIPRGLFAVLALIYLGTTLTLVLAAEARPAHKAPPHVYSTRHNGSGKHSR